MFNSIHPPILVLLMTTEQAAYFPAKDGYIHHALGDDQVALCHREGWTFSVSAEQRQFITRKPMLLVKNSGGVTSEGSTFLKGYANQFVDDEGKEPEYDLKRAMFPDEQQAEWMMVSDKVNVIWLQYGYKNQHLGLAHDEQENHYGKLMIRSLTVMEDFAPRFDRKADIVEMHSMQYRVYDRLLLDMSWNRTDGSSLQQIQELLHSRKLDNYRDAVNVALQRAGFNG